ncbi:MAG: histidine triad nucleotide-binding protein [Candidatus Omnitrophota bacterium]|nr:histidine triad nucleotide-binding protein [Candidatus Omnitrophota bacterium]
MAPGSCLFCKIANKEVPAKIVFEDNMVIAFEDIKPQAPVHILVIPKYHIDKVSDLDDDNIHLIGRLVLTAKNIAKEKNIHESGYRIVLNCNKDAGQDVFHIHLHLLGGRKFVWPPG